jgi:hypothetical protein
VRIKIRRNDGKAFTAAQIKWAEAYSAGYVVGYQNASRKKDAEIYLLRELIVKILV